MSKTNFFSNKMTSVLLCLLACALWGSLFPFIKVGYGFFKISADDMPSIILFAGMRFTISGIIIMTISGKKEEQNLKKSYKKYIFLGALFTIVLHYGFTYIALSLGEGSKSAIIKQIGFLFLSCFAFLFDKEDKWSARKMVAGILGFLGIIATNSDNTGIAFKIGDALLILASFCGVFGSVVAKKAVKTMSPVKFVAYSQFVGGAVMCVTGFILGGRISYIDLKAVLIFMYICVASISAYLIWNVLIKYNSLSKLSIIKFTEPLFAVVLSGIILQEKILRFSYAVALILILAAIIIENYKESTKDNG